MKLIYFFSVCLVYLICIHEFNSTFCFKIPNHVHWFFKKHFYFRWIQNLEAHGSRNLLSAFRTAVENDEDLKEFGGVQGVYLLGSGIADQEEVGVLMRSEVG